MTQRSLSQVDENATVESVGRVRQNAVSPRRNGEQMKRSPVIDDADNRPAAAFPSHSYLVRIMGVTIKFR